MVIDLVTVSSEERDIGLLTQQNRELIEGKNKLLDKIETYQIDLTEKQKAIEELEERAKQASQGVTTVYWFNGTARKTHGPNIRLDHHLVRIFDRMVELQNDKKFMELSQLCEEQIEKHPQWSTPHVFMGVVAANLGDVDRAIRSFQYFLDNAPAEPSYGYGKARAQARELLNSLKSKK